MTWIREFCDFLSRWRASLVLLGFYAIALGVGTLLESVLGTEAARAAIYHAWWMYVLYGLLIANFVLIARRMRMLKRRRWGALLLHGGLIVVILGAWVTHLQGYEGTLHLREGETSDLLRVSHTDWHTLPFQVTLHDFRLVRYPGSHTPASYESDLTVHFRGTSRREKIYMNRIARVGGFRLYQSSYDPDERGTILSVNYDPVGTPLTYAGYFLVIAGLFATLAQRGSRLRELLARLELLSAGPASRPSSPSDPGL